MTFQSNGGSALCRRSAELYQQNGHWFVEPEIGDQIFFYYGGEINHTGIVTSVNGDNITCVEGNHSDGVGRTYYNWKISNQIAGFGRPNWNLVTQITDGNISESPSDDLSEQIQNGKPNLSLGERSYLHLSYGDGIDSPSPAVKAWQNLLICWGFNLGRYGADGEFGSSTQNATIQFQQKVGLTPNGIVDEDSWKQAIYVG